MKKLILTLLAMSYLPAQAALHDRGDGFIYDDVLDVTWTQDPAINGTALWPDQVAWADGYSQTHSVYGTFSDWRLASMDVDNSGTPVDCSEASETDCRDNEYGYLYHQYGISQTSPGIFTGLDGLGEPHWSGTKDADDSTKSWRFRFGLGTQKPAENDKLIQSYAWAVRDGDIATVIDIEPTILHPHHDGRLGPQGIASFPDDVIAVVVFGASTAAGDPEDRNTDNIDPATLSFGRGGGAISPTHPPEFNLDEDSDGIDDARFRFLMSDAAFICTDESGVLTGDLTTGGSFAGSDTFTSDCGAVCH